MVTRRERFAKPRPAGWKPRPGDHVYIARIAKTLGMLTGRGMVIGSTIDPDYWRVRIWYGRQVSSDLWHIDELRPVR
jgi:hypothetical protein